MNVSFRYAHWSPQCPIFTARMELAAAFHGIGCWEQELKDQSHTLYTHGRWYIDSTCVDTLKDLGSRVAKSVLVDVLQHWLFRLERAGQRSGVRKGFKSLPATFLHELTSRGGDASREIFLGQVEVHCVSIFATSPPLVKEIIQCTSIVCIVDSR